MGWTLTENLEKLIRDATERLFLGKAIEFAARLARSVSGRTPSFLGDTRPGIQFGPGNDPPTKASGGPPLSQGSAFTDVVALTGVHRPSSTASPKRKTRGFVSETLSLIIM